jgi:hypothetical protein
MRPSNRRSHSRHHAQKADAFACNDCVFVVEFLVLCYTSVKLFRPLTILRRSSCCGLKLHCNDASPHMHLLLLFHLPRIHTVALDVFY